MSMLLPKETLLRPCYEIYFNDVKLDDSLKKYITQVQVEESDSEADLGRITVADIDFVFSKMTQLKEKMPVKIYMGHIGKMRLMLSGEVTHIDADYGEEGVPSLTIGAIDMTNKMTSVKKQRTWKNKKASDIALAILGEYKGLKVSVETTKNVLEQVTQEKETDAQILARLADDEGFIFCFISSSNTVYFRDKLSTPKEKDTVYYNSGDSTVRYFRPTFVEKNKPQNNTTKADDKKSVSDKTGKKVVSKSTPASTPKTTSQASSKTNSKTSGISVKTGTVKRSVYEGR